jgi:hypothetical protein
MKAQYKIGSRASVGFESMPIFFVLVVFAFRVPAHHYFDGSSMVVEAQRSLFPDFFCLFYDFGSLIGGEIGSATGLRPVR